MTINNKSERNYRGKCLGSPVTSYGGGLHCDWLGGGQFIVSVKFALLCILIRAGSKSLVLSNCTRLKVPAILNEFPNITSQKNPKIVLTFI